MESAGCMRMVIPMGINESPSEDRPNSLIPEFLRHADIQGEPLKRWEHVVMFPPRDAMDQAERDRTFWQVAEVLFRRSDKIQGRVESRADN